MYFFFITPALEMHSGDIVQEYYSQIHANIKKIRNKPIFCTKLSNGMYITVLKVPIDQMCASDVLLTSLIYPCQTQYRLKMVKMVK